jgi:hypothetical protein
MVVLQPAETVPKEEVERVSEYLIEGGYEPFHIETQHDSAKITVRYNSGGGGEEGTCTEVSP